MTPDRHRFWTAVSRTWEGPLIGAAAALLQAGAGIVAGSEAAQEFAETEAKMGTLLDALLDCKENRHFA